MKRNQMTRLLNALLLAVPAMMLAGNTLAEDTSIAADQRPVANDIKGRGIARYAVASNGSKVLLNNAQRYAINLPEPINERIGIVDEDSAAAADVELWLATSDGEVYARCQLEGGDVVKINPDGIEHVTYKLALRQSGDNITGGNTCTEGSDTDPDDVQPNQGIMPMVADGDLAQGVVIVDGKPVLALEGEFE